MPVLCETTKIMSYVVYELKQEAQVVTPVADTESPGGQPTGGVSTADQLQRRSPEDL